jgi:hypothetical protein
MTFDAGSSRVVAFGGGRFCGVDLFRDSTLWSWDGAQWSRTPTTFREPREDVLLTYDTGRRVLVLHGGRVPGRVFADTWEWDGRAWSQRSDSARSPGKLEHASMAYDPRRGRTVLFGGAVGTGGMRDETWEWDGATWTRISSGGPPRRIGHSMVWSPALDAVAMYGGFNEEGSLRDLWAWKGTAWTLVDSLGPAHTEGPGLASLDSTLIVIGRPVGAPGEPERFSTWVRRGRGWEALATAGPPLTIGPAMAYDASRRALVLFGGAPSPNSAPSSQTWEFREGRWSLVRE